MRPALAVPPHSDRPPRARHEPSMQSYEADRLESLRSYGVFGTASERTYDGLTRLAAHLCRTPIALISLSGENQQWAKSLYGSPFPPQVPRRMAFSQDVVESGRQLVIPDTTRNPKFAANPLVTAEPHIRAYAGVPLIGRDGLPLGALCVLDRRPRRFTAGQLEGLQLLAEQIVTQFELRRLDHSVGGAAGALLSETTDALRLRRALDNHELHPHFQPIVDLRNGKCVAVEALLRWEHPELGLVPPAMFLRAIESSRLIIPVGRLVLDESLDLLAELRADTRLPEGFSVSVNVSGAQLREPGLAEAVLSAVHRYGVPPRALALELTETQPIDNPANACRELATLREAGVQLALDDYGVGWSALSRLLELPFTALKLDRVLVSGLPADRRSAAIAQSTMRLADDMGLTVVCEGVETEDQRQALLAMKATRGQGWLFGRPMGRASVRSFLLGH